MRVVGIDDFGDRSVGAIVDRMAVGIGQTAIQAAEISADSDLQRVVFRLGDVAAMRDATDAVERTGRIGRDSACDRQVGRDGPAHRLAVHRAGIAIAAVPETLLQSSAEIAWPGP